MSQLTLTANDPVVARSKALLEHIFPSPRNFTINFWNQDMLLAASDPAFTLVLNHPGTLRRMFSPPIELSLGEAYIYGDFDIQGDFYAAFGLIEALRSRNFTANEIAILITDAQGLSKSGPTRSIVRKPLELSGELHSRERDRKAISFHYNIGNEFYALWLDHQMQYSCGYFPTGTEDLDTAQIRKIDHICRKLRLIPAAEALPMVADLEAQGKTLLFLESDQKLTGILAASDTLRSEVPAALAEARSLGIRHIELLTGDNERTASTLAEKLGVSYRTNLLPEHKIDVVKEYQAKGHIVVMIGDGVNDAPALAQANVGIAMGAAGTDVAIEAAHIALMREDWMLIPEALRIAQRTMGIVKMNLGFTALYNVVGLTLAAFGFLPPVLAAAAQSLPDIGIMGNSARLIRQK